MNSFSSWWTLLPTWPLPSGWRHRQSAVPENKGLVCRGESFAPLFSLRSLSRSIHCILATARVWARAHAHAHTSHHPTPSPLSRPICRDDGSQQHRAPIVSRHCRTSFLREWRHGSFTVKPYTLLSRSVHSDWNRRTFKPVCLKATGRFNDICHIFRWCLCCQ